MVSMWVTFTSFLQIYLFSEASWARREEPKTALFVSDE